VEEVPGSQPPLAALDDRDALAGEHEEILLVVLAVVEAARAALAEHGDRVPDLGKRHLVALDDAGCAELRVPHPGGVADVHDEPAVRHRRPAVPRVLQPRLVHEATIATLWHHWWSATEEGSS
jgi:hypothetical protein